jgi:hypothetical protein
VLNLSLGKEQHISIVLRKEHSHACRHLAGAIDKYVNSNAWLDDLRYQLVDEYSRRAPGDPDMTDQQIRERFQPSVLNTDRCVDPLPANAMN